MSDVLGGLLSFCVQKALPLVGPLVRDLEDMAKKKTKLQKELCNTSGFYVQSLVGSIFIAKKPARPLIRVVSRNPFWDGCLLA